MLRPRKPSSAFTLLELIVVIVILAVLAAIAVPTFKAVIDRSSDAAAETSLSSYAREVQAHAAFDGDTILTDDDFTKTAPDLTSFGAAPGLVAAAVTVVKAPEAASRTSSAAVVSYAISGDGSRAGIAGVSASGSCVAVQLTATTVNLVDATASGTDCNGATALAGEIREGSPSGDAEPVAAPVAPSSFTGSITGTTATLNWAAVPGATSYRLDRTLNGTTTAVYSGTDLTHIDAGLAEGTEYSYQVTVSNTRGSATSGTLKLTSIPATPTGLTARMVDGGVGLSWQQAPGATGYDIYRSADGADFLFLNATHGDLEYHNTGLQAGTTYSYYVKAKNGAGTSEASNTVSQTTAPATPTLTASVAGRDVTLSWNAPTGATSYEVFRESVSLGVVTTLTYTDPARPVGTHNYSVVAIGSGRSAPGTATVTVQEYGALVAGSSDLAGYWRLGDAPGSGTALDSSGNGSNGTTNVVFGHTGALAGSANTAAGFNGSFSKVTVPDATKLHLQGSWTMEVWMKPDSTTVNTYDYVLMKAGTTVGSDTNNYALIYGYGTPGMVELYRQFGTGGDIRTGTGMMIPSTTEWTHVVYTYDGTTLRGYINGVEKVSKVVAVGFKTSTGALTIGAVTGAADNNAEFYAGKLDEVALYNRAITASEVAAHASYR